eukprot:7384202-Prymnesium_polylepis.2
MAVALPASCWRVAASSATVLALIGGVPDWLPPLAVIPLAVTLIGGPPGTADSMPPDTDCAPLGKPVEKTLNRLWWPCSSASHATSVVAFSRSVPSLSLLRAHGGKVGTAQWRVCGAVGGGCGIGHLRCGKHTRPDVEALCRGGVVAGRVVDTLPQQRKAPLVVPEQLLELHDGQGCPLANRLREYRTKDLIDRDAGREEGREACRVLVVQVCRPADPLVGFVGHLLEARQEVIPMNGWLARVELAAVKCVPQRARLVTHLLAGDGCMDERDGRQRQRGVGRRDRDHHSTLVVREGGVDGAQVHDQHMNINVQKGGLSPVRPKCVRLRALLLRARHTHRGCLLSRRESHRHRLRRSRRLCHDLTEAGAVDSPRRQQTQSLQGHRWYLAGCGVHLGPEQRGVAIGHRQFQDAQLLLWRQREVRQREAQIAIPLAPRSGAKGGERVHFEWQLRQHLLLIQRSVFEMPRNRRLPLLEVERRVRLSHCAATAFDGLADHLVLVDVKARPQKTRVDYRSGLVKLAGADDLLGARLAEAWVLALDRERG